VIEIIDKLRFERMPLERRIDIVVLNAIAETTATIATKARIRFATPTHRKGE